MLDAVTIGETMALFSPIRSGSLKYVDYFRKQVGGAESNFAIGVVRLGRTAGWISKVGDDPFGSYIISCIRGEGVDTSRVKVDKEAPTAVYFKEFHELGDPRVYYYRSGSAASRLQPEDLDEEYISQAKVLHITGITPALSKSARDTVNAAVYLAKKHKLKISFDPNIRKKLWSEKECRETIISLVHETDILLPNLKEAEFLLEESDPEVICKKFLEMGPATVALKLGRDGCIVANGEKIIKIGGMEVKKVVDPVGAGDGFDAGFIVGMLNGWNLTQCGELANAVGARVVTVNGDVEGLPNWREIDEFRGNIKVVDR